MKCILYLIALLSGVLFIAAPLGMAGYYPGKEVNPPSPKRQRVNSGGDQRCTRGRVGLGGGSFPPG